MTSHVSIHRLSVTLASLLAVSALLACAPAIRATRSAPIGPTQLAELWTAPTNQGARNLFFGVGGKELAPTPGARFTFLAKDTTGFSPGYDVKDTRGMEWSVKFGPEAPAEVVASRLIWAVGYHQPPTYFVPKWTLVGGEAPGPQPVARFRPKLPWQEKVGEWSWHHNPFVGTVPYRGLIVLMVMLNNSDLKSSNNALYELSRPLEGARRWYVVRDVGHSLGETGIMDARRSDLPAFEKHGFITSVEGGRVRFEYHGRHDELIDQVTPEDVRWICARLDRLTEKQWKDAFRAGGYAPEIAERFIRKFREKIAQGKRLAVPSPPRGARS